ncbi:MAG: serine/threonine-protein kinase [Nannocystaceae bacterium]|nr:serine/threonine-protein kinase [Nannocystaceae bacterium]
MTTPGAEPSVPGNALPTEVGSLGPAPALDSVAAAARRAEIRARLFEGHGEPLRIGRYEIRGRLGAGAFGVVYRGWDARLGREVAIKLLHGRGPASAGLRREARAMAKISHPAIGAVYELGEHASRPFVVMELVEGVTLRAWQQGRSSAEIVAMYRQVAEGLAAAHRAGVVHRDFKPDNAMVDRAGRVRVLDFGLARGGEPPLPGSDVTRSQGAGTPAYMAPELFAGGVGGPAADQFAFCVALFEALCGTRPFGGRDLVALATAVSDGRIEATAAQRRVDRRLMAVVLRGLRPDPAARHCDMVALGHALGRALARRRRGALVLGGTALAAVALWLVLPRASSGCARGWGRLEGVWDRERAAQADRAIAASGDAALQAAWPSRRSALDEGATQWREAVASLCASEHEDPLERACLEDVRAELAARSELARADELLALRWVVFDAPPLLSLPQCRERRARGELPAPGPIAQQLAIADVAAALAGANAWGRAGNVDRALAGSTDALERARAIGHPPLLAEALFTHSAALDAAGRVFEAEAAAQQAYEVALGSRNDRMAARAAVAMVELVGYRLARHDEGEAWARNAEAVLQRLDAGSGIWADFFVNRGLLRVQQRRLPEARADLERAVERYTDAEGPGSARLTAPLSNLAQIAYLQRDYDASLGWLDRALTIERTHGGPTHPAVADYLSNRALVLLAADRTDEAARSIDEAAALLEAASAPAGERAVVLRNRGEIAYARGRFDAAAQDLASAVAQHERVRGVAEDRSVGARISLGRVRARMGDAAAEAVLQDALARAEAAGSGADVAAASAELVGVALDRGDLESAARALEHVALADAGDLEPDLAFDLELQRARWFVAQRRWDDALARLDGALSQTEGALQASIATAELWRGVVLAHRDGGRSDLAIAAARRGAARLRAAGWGATLPGWRTAFEDAGLDAALLLEASQRDQK